MSTLRRRKQLISQLIRSVRGQWSTSTPIVGGGSNASAAPATKTLPCFPLEQHHFGRISDKCLVSSGSGDPGVATPSDFHSYLCARIERARERIIIATLYVGVGSNGNSNSDHRASTSTRNDSTTDGNCKEDKLLRAIEDASCNNNLKKVQFLLDANRALRKVSVTNKQRQSHGPSPSGRHGHIRTNSAEAVHSRLNRFLESSPNDQSSNSGLFLFPVNDTRLRKILPSPLDEVAGVFHIKAYIVDDDLILSGANLSEDYFTNRLDRYMLFTNGGGGLVDFYADLCDILCDYAIRYDGRSKNTANDLSSFFSSQDEVARKEKLEASLMHLFDGNNQSHEFENGQNKNSVAYAIPTLQIPTAFLGRPFRFRSDAESTRRLLVSALQHERSASVRLSSAYLNPTPGLLSALTLYGKKHVGAPYILSAGAISHGFAPKAGGSQKNRVGIVNKIKSAIPEAFLTLAKETKRSIMNNGGKILLYERLGWTFHAKGIWITANDDDGGRQHPELIKNPSSLLATMIGSGNYGWRSENLDVESNCILVFNDSKDRGLIKGGDVNDSKDGGLIEGGNVCSMKENVAAEWNHMCKYSNELEEDVHTGDNSVTVTRFVLEFVKRYL